MKTTNDGYGRRECRKHGWQDIDGCYYIHKRNGRSSVEYVCIKCSKEKSIKNKEKIKEYKKKYNVECKDVIKKYQRANVEKISNRRKARRQAHLEEEFEAIRKYRIENKDAIHQQQKERRDALRLEVITHYSPNLCCEICGENHYEFLALDHKLNNGADHRRRVGSSFRIYLDVKNSEYPDEYRVLCHNCNLKYRDNSKCANRIKVKEKPQKEFSDNIRAIYSRKYVEKNKELIKAKERLRGEKLKKEIIDNYGGKCNCCGINDIKVLSIDHIYGGGKAHCKEIGGCGNVLYNWLKANGYPKDKFRLLCMNCNRSFGSYGYCPHEKENNVKNMYSNDGNVQ